MSKVDAMRALREARRAAASKDAPAPRVAARAPPPAARAASPDQASPDQVSPAEAGPAESLCGHRNMGGRSCTREADHIKNGTKNHRYG